MFRMTRLAALATALFTLASLTAVRAEDPKPADGGKGSAFKSKSYDLEAGAEKAITLSFVAGKEATVTTTGAKEVTTHLYVKGRYYEAKDTSPGPDCLVKFTPAEGDASFTLTIKNTGKAASKVTLEVKVAE